MRQKRFGMMTSIEDAEKQAKLIDDDQAKNRILYHLEMAKPHRARIEKAIYKSYKDKAYCSHCGFELYQPTWNYCPDCGYRIEDGYHVGYIMKENK